MARFREQSDRIEPNVRAELLLVVVVVVVVAVVVVVGKETDRKRDSCYKSTKLG